MAMYPRPNVRQAETEFEYYQQQRRSAPVLATVLLGVRYAAVLVLVIVAAVAFWNMGW